MKTFPLLSLALLISYTVLGQTKHVVSGYIKDEKTGEALIGATIMVKEKTGIAITTNSYGFYSLTLPAGNYTLLITAIGYEASPIPLSLTQNRQLDLRIKPAARELEEVVVAARKEVSKLRQTTMGIERLNLSETSKIPVIMGERDIIKVLQLLPGVKNAGEGSAGFHVRGGGADQNLILLDEAPVYNATHLMGFFSVFNADALKDVTLYKGNMPAEYGGRLSSVLDIKMKDGNDQQYGVDGGIGLLASRLSVQGPIVKDKGSFIVSGRRTYADLFLGLSSDETVKDSKLYFYDLNVKANYRINNKNKVFLSGYFGKDVMGISDFFNLDWGNTTATFRWNHIFNSRLFSNTSLIYSNYKYKVTNDDLGGNKVHTTSEITDYNFKQDFQFTPGNNHQVKFGINSIYHTINPGTLTSTAGLQSSNLRLKRYAWENAAYASHEMKITKQLTINYGLRLSSFSVIGPGDFYNMQYNGTSKFYDTLSYSNKKIIKTYFNLEPRFSAAYVIDNNNSVKAAYTRSTQNLHLISSLTVAQPTDLWIPSSLIVKPEISDQFSVGYFRTLGNNAYELSVEGYYKILQNQVDYKDGAQLEFNSSVETELVFGKGRAYGAELLVKKKKGKLTGWFGYTLAKTERQFPEINNGQYYPTRYDRTHDISIVAMYTLNKKWSFSANWVYYTGNAVTFPSGKYEINGNIVNYYTERNGYRMPDYHRLDLGATLQGKKRIRYESSWTFSVYNAYGRENPFMMKFRKSQTDPSRTEAVQYSLFKFVPSVTYNFKF